MDYPSIDEVPEKIRKQMQICGRVGYPGGLTRFFAQGYRQEGSLTILNNVLSDTSDRSQVGQGVVLKVRWSHTPTLYVANQPLCFRMIEADERKEIFFETDTPVVEELVTSAVV